MRTDFSKISAKNYANSINENKIGRQNHNKNNVTFGDFYANTTEKILVDTFYRVSDVPKHKINVLVNNFMSVLKYREKHGKGSFIKTVVSTDNVGNLMAKIGVEPLAKMQRVVPQLADIEDKVIKGNIFTRQDSINFWHDINSAQDEVIRQGQSIK